MSKSNKYGYSGVDIPTQAFKANVGKFDPAEINELVQEDKWTQYGQLELIETQTISSATADFTTLQETTYNVHFFTFTDVHVGSQTEFGYKVSNDGGTSFNTGTPFQFANNRIVSDGANASRKSTGQASGRLCGDIDTGAHSLANGYLYLYNAGDSTKHTMSTSHMVFEDFQDLGAMEFGSQMYEGTPKFNNAIRFGAGTGTTALTSATISCYGIRYA
jgi:hypothetical protein